MALTTNANWDASAAATSQTPVYVLQIDGVSEEYCTTTPQDAGGGTTYRALMNTPSGGGGSVDVIDGNRTVRSVSVELLDTSDLITTLVATDAPGATVSSLINRGATILGGYANIDVADYVQLFTGKIRGLKMNRSRTGYVLNIVDMTAALDQDIFTGASSDTPAYLEGNVVNVYASILRGTFSTSDPDFPLDVVSGATVTGQHDGSNNQNVLSDSGASWTENEFVGLTIQNTSDGSSGVVTANTATTVTAVLSGGTDNDWDTNDFYSIGSSTATGLGIADADLDFTKMKEQREVWHFDDTVRLVVDSVENARQYLTDQFFRIFQAWPTVTGGGKIGVGFHVPALPLEDAIEINETHIVSVDGWERALEDHLNKFTINGDHGIDDGAFDTELYAYSDTTDQTATGETREYIANSEWLRSDKNGAEIAEELAERHRVRYTKTPAVLKVSVNFQKRTIEEGDVVAVTLRDVPNLIAGTRGIENNLMTVLNAQPSWAAGVIKLTLLDTGFKRYGVIAPDALSSSTNFSNATEKEKRTFFAFCNGSDQMSDGTPGYRFT